MRSGGARSAGEEALRDEGETMIFDGGLGSAILGDRSGGGKEVSFEVEERWRIASAEYRWFFARDGMVGGRGISEWFRPWCERFRGSFEGSFGAKKSSSEFPASSSR